MNTPGPQLSRWQDGANRLLQTAKRFPLNRKRIIRLALFGTAFVFLIGDVRAQNFQSNFDGAFGGTFSVDFNQNGPQVGNLFQTTSGGGISGTNAVGLTNFQNDSTAIYRNTVFDFTAAVGTSWTVAGYFRDQQNTQTGLSIATAIFQIGFGSDVGTAQNTGTSFNTGLVTLTGSNPTLENFLTARVVGDGSLQFQVGIGGATTATFIDIPTTGSPNSLIDGNLYFLTATFTKLSTAGQFNGTMALYNAAADGTLGSIVASIGNSTLTSTAIYGDSTVYAGFRAVGASVAGFSGVKYVDNFAAGVVPGAVTDPASMVLAASAALNGHIPTGAYQTAHFEWGLTTNYGNIAPALLGSSSGGTDSLNTALTGLQPVTTYHYRLVGQLPEITALGNDQVFQTTTELVVQDPTGVALTNGVSTADFGSGPAGTQISETFTIKNLGASPLQIHSITIDGVNSGDFALTSPVPSSVAGGSSATFTLGFTPNSGFSRSAVLHISSSDPGSPSFSVGLAGTCIETFNATYSAATDIPITGSYVTATGSKLNIALNYAPATGAQLTVLKNTGKTFITGFFNDLAQGQIVALDYAGIIYTFSADYYGGSGRDLVLQWANTRLLDWGSNSAGQLGNGTTINGGIPEPIDTSTTLFGKLITKVASGSAHSVALCTDGTITAWGSNSFGQLGDNNTVAQLTPVTTYLGGALLGKTVATMAVGASHTVALCSDGTLVAWGFNTFGQLGNGNTVNSIAPVAIPATGVLSGREVIAVAAGSNHNLALCSDGGLVAWGNNSSGQLGNGGAANSSAPIAVTTNGILSVKTISALAAGANFSVALCSDGSLATWGSNSLGQLGNGTTVSSSIPTLVSTNGALAGKIVTAVAAGSSHCVALCSDGTVVAWGANGNGQLGNNSTTSSNVPVQVLAGGALSSETVVAVAAGNSHSLVMCADGMLASWGANSQDQLGNGGGAQSLVPVAVSSAMLGIGERFISTKAGQSASHSFAIVATPPEPEIAIELPGGARFTNGISTVDFGAGPVGTGSTRIFTVENAGSAPLILGSMVFGGINAADFSLSSPPDPTVAPGSSTTFAITFTRSAAGARGATVQIPSNDPLQNPFTITLVAGPAVWTGAGDGVSWSDPNNWVGGVVPGAETDVIINGAAGSPVNFTNAAGAIDIHSLTCTQPLNVSGGALRVDTTIQISQNLTLSGGTIENGTIIVARGASFKATGGTLDAVTLGSDLAVEDGSTLTVRDGLIFDGGNLLLVSTTKTTTLQCDGTQSLGGTGEIVFSGTVPLNQVLVEGGGSQDTAAALTIEPGVTVHGTQGGMLSWVYGFDSIINQGTINADSAGQVITVTDPPPGFTIDSGNVTFINEGILQASNGTLTVDPAVWESAGTLEAFASGALELGGALTIDSQNNEAAVVSGSVNILAGAVVNLAPGVVVKFAPGINSELVLGDGATVNAPGTEDEPIILTSLADDSVGGDSNQDGGITTPQLGDWAGFSIGSGATANLNQYVHFRYVRIPYLQYSFAGTLPANTTWSGMNVINGVIYVPAGVTLTLQAGAVVKFPPGTGIDVLNGGALIADGTVAQPIIFTSLKDDSVGGDTNRDGNTTSPAAGDWQSIRFESGATGNLHFASFVYGGNSSFNQFNAGGMIENLAGSVTMQDCIVSQSLKEGIIAGGLTTVSECLVTFNDRGIDAFGGTGGGSGATTAINCTLDSNRIGLIVHGGSLDASNNLVTNSLTSGVEYDFGSSPSMRYSDVWSASGANYVGAANITGSNGNISVDPKYKNAAQGDYRLNFLSPAIDAADGTVAPNTDLAGAVRYNDPRTRAKTGVADGNGNYPDIGAYEFVETAASNVALAANTVVGPNAAVSGQKVHLTWFDANAGSASAAGPWHDTVKLVFDPYGTPTTIPVGDVLVAQNTVLGSNQSIGLQADVVVPYAAPGNYYWQVVADSHEDVYEGQNLANGGAISVLPTALDLPPIDLGAAPLDGTFSAAGQGIAYKLALTPGQDTLIQLSVGADQSAVELYIGQGYIPTPGHYDFKSSQFNSALASLVLSAPSAAPYYIVAYPRTLDAQTVNFTLSAQASSFSLVSVSPSQVGTGSVTLKLQGGQLRSDDTYELLSPEGTTYAATAVYPQDSTTLYATFDLTGAALGSYNVSLLRSGAPQGSLPKAVTVQTATPPSLVARVVSPLNCRVARPFSCSVTYQNAGNTDIPAPLLIISNDFGVVMRLQANDPFSSARLLLMGISFEGPAGILRPGGHWEIPFTAQTATNVTGQVLFTLTAYDGDSVTTLDWTALQAQLRPAGVSDSVWTAAFTQFQALAGNTWGSYVTLLARYATILGSENSELPGFSGAAVMAAAVDDIIAQVSSSAVGKLSLNDADHPLANTAIELSGSDGTLVVAISEGDGTFYVPTVPTGVYTISVPGYLVSGSNQLSIPATDVTLTVSHGGEISGYIRASATGAPLSGAAISAVNSSGQSFGDISGTDGSYSLIGLPDADYSITTEAEGFTSATQSNVDVSNGGYVKGTDFQLAANATIEGRVFSAIGDVTINNAPITLSTELGPIQTAITDSNGAFIFTDVVAANYTLEYDPPTGLPAQLNVSVAAGQTLTGVALPVHTGATLTGAIVDKTTGEPLANLAVIAIAATGVEFFAQTDSNGKYSFLSLAPGTYALNAVGNIASSAITVNINTLDGPEVAANCSVATVGVVRGSLQDSAGNPIQGSVALYEAGYLISTSQSDADGNYNFVFLQSGQFNLQPFAANATFPPVTLTVGGGSSLLQDINAGTSALHFSVASSGEATTGAIAGLYQHTENGLLFCGFNQVDKNGELIFANLVPGNYRITITTADNYGCIEEATVPQNISTSLVAVPLQTVTGSITDVTGKAIIGATVMISDALASLSFLGTSGGDGSYIAQDVPSGTYTVTILADGYATLIEPNVNVTQTVTLDERLIASSTEVIGRLADKGGNPIASGSISVSDAFGNRVGGSLTASDGTFSINTAVGSDLSIVASAAGATPVTVPLTAMSNTLTDVGTILISKTVLAGNIGASSASLALQKMTTTSELLFRQVSALNTPGFQTNNETGPIDQAAAMERDKEQLLKLPAYVDDTPEKDEPPSAPTGHSGDAIDTYNHDLYNRWNTAEEMVDSDRDDLGLFLQQFTIDLNNLQEAIDLLTSYSNTLIADAIEFGFVAVATLPAAILITIRFPQLLPADIAFAKALGPLIATASAIVAEKQTNPSEPIDPSVITQFTVLLHLYNGTILEESVKELIDDLGGLFGLANDLSNIGLVMAEYLYEFQQIEALVSVASASQMTAGAAAATLERDFITMEALFQTDYLPFPSDSDDGDDCDGNSDTKVSGSHDPNDLVSNGYGPQGYIGSTVAVPFTIDFQNTSTATAPAQQVMITEALSPNLDWSTFQLQSIYFNNVTIQVPPGVQQYTTQVNVASDPNPVLVTASLNPTTGVVTWSMTSIDSITGQLVMDPLAGFLPPDDVNGDGEGYVTYTIRPKSGLASGTVLTSQASIVFDANDPILTNQAINTIDDQAPASVVHILPAAVPTSFLVQWGGADDHSGSGLAAYTIYVTDDGGSTWQKWLQNTTKTEAVFTGAAGKSYGFYSIAVDHVGNQQTPPLTANTTTQSFATASNNSTVIVTKGDPAPGIVNAKFSSADLPAIDGAGEIAFKGFVTGTEKKSDITTMNNSGIWLFGGSNGALIAQTGTTAPGTNGAIFESLGDPVLNSNGNIAFLGGLVNGKGDAKRGANAAGIWLSRNGTVSIAVRAGDVAPGLTNVNFAAFTQAVLPDAGGVAFLATLNGHGVKNGNNIGVWATDLSGNLQKVLRTGDSLSVGGSSKTISGIKIFQTPKFVSGQSRNIDGINGNLAFSLGFSDKSSAIVTAQAGADGFTTAWVTGSGTGNVPGIANAEISALGSPAVNKTRAVSYHATVSGATKSAGISSKNNSGIWLDDGTSSSLLVRAGSSAVGTNGSIFAGVTDPVLNNAGSIAFIGNLEIGVGDVKKSANSTGVWSNSLGAMQMAARAGDPAPGTVGANFASFNQVVLPDTGGPILLATLDRSKASENQGVWVQRSNGALDLLTRKGDTISVHGTPKVIVAIKVFQVCPSVSGQSRHFDAGTDNLVYWAMFSDHSWGILEVP